MWHRLIRIPSLYETLDFKHEMVPPAVLFLEEKRLALITIAKEIDALVKRADDMELNELTNNLPLTEIPKISEITNFKDFTHSIGEVKKTLEARYQAIESECDKINQDSIKHKQTYNLLNEALDEVYHPYVDALLLNHHSLDQNALYLSNDNQNDELCVSAELQRNPIRDILLAQDTIDDLLPNIEEVENGKEQCKKALSALKEKAKINKKEKLKLCNKINLITTIEDKSLSFSTQFSELRNQLYKEFMEQGDLEYSKKQIIAIHSFLKFMSQILPLNPIEDSSEKDIFYTADGYQLNLKTIFESNQKMITSSIIMNKLVNPVTEKPFCQLDFIAIKERVEALKYFKHATLLDKSIGLFANKDATQTSLPLDKLNEDFSNQSDEQFSNPPAP